MYSCIPIYDRPSNNDVWKNRPLGIISMVNNFNGWPLADQIKKSELLSFDGVVRNWRLSIWFWNLMMNPPKSFHNFVSCLIAYNLPVVERNALLISFSWCIESQYGSALRVKTPLITTRTGWAESTLPNRIKTSDHLRWSISIDYFADGYPCLRVKLRNCIPK